MGAKPLSVMADLESVSSFDIEDALASSKQIVQPFKPIPSYVREASNKRMLAVFFIFGCLLFFILRGDIDLSEAFKVCTQESGGVEKSCKRVEQWKPLFVATVLFSAIACMVQGFRAEFMLLCAILLFGIAGISTPEGALSGFSSDGNIAVQGLLIMFRGIEESGVLERIFSTLLGAPKYRQIALLRSQLLSFVLSGVVSGGPVTLAGAPALQKWAPSVRLTSRETLLPFAFAASLGQSLLVVSSPVSLVVKSNMHGAKIGMFDPICGSVMLFLIAAMYTVFFSPITFNSQSTAPEEADESSSASPSTVPNTFTTRDLHKRGDLYTVKFSVSPHSLLLGRSLARAGLLALPGVVFLGSDAEANAPLVVNEILTFAVAAQTLPRLRVLGHGLLLQEFRRTSFFDKLGGRRHLRQLYECIVIDDSPLLDRSFPVYIPRGTCVGVRRSKSTWFHYV
eukprot:TRINITY_DN2461_c1_g1_i2.p1 TRINITY_DN2461_c1_g1~~TRINITY_DN2461_c1_g1_i2.p1  ORF type:complete len:466 (+),score=21.71 TRINITY_DN2461_c1_g1_i2:40-1398(+)